MNSAGAQLLDVVIVGAGISGISAACYLKMQCPEKRYRIIESRGSVGGTWDLFAIPAYAPTVTCTPLVSNLSLDPAQVDF